MVKTELSTAPIAMVWLFILLPLVTVGCSGSGDNDTTDASNAIDGDTDGEMDFSDGDIFVDVDAAVVGCEWFEGENCWKDSLEAIKPCCHDTEEMGVLNSEGLRCTFTDTTLIEFEDPITFPISEYYIWSYIIKKNDSLCMSFTQGDEKPIIITSSLGVFTLSSIDYSLEITCPDGKRYSVPDSLSLLDCPEGIPSYGALFPGESQRVHFSLGIGENEPLNVFSCERN